jgi:hypothetical protein
VRFRRGEGLDNSTRTCRGNTEWILGSQDTAGGGANPPIPVRESRQHDVNVLLNEGPSLETAQRCRTDHWLVIDHEPALRFSGRLGTGA